MAHLKAFIFVMAYRAFRPVCLFFALFGASLLLFPFSSVHAGDTPYLDDLLKSAREKRLSDERYWDVLLHYKKNGSGRKSLVDDPRFFLAPDGKVNPAAELEATLRSFFHEEKKDEEHPRCRFIARYAWLKEELNIDEQRIPPAACTEFKDAFARIHPYSATLVFPTALNNGPASMFGHTLIRIDRENQSGLLSYAATYAAYAPNPNAFLYPIKGLFGFYPGYYSILPYYDKVSEYSNIESRDIWEYPLNLTEAEVGRMVMHLWEVRDIYSDYYFFDENCSFDLLFLLEAARPSLHLSDVFWDNQFRFWVMPVDTIREIKKSGLITGEMYRPSHARRILTIASSMERDHRRLALDVADRRISPQAIVDMSMTPEEKTKVLDLSAELLQYHYARKEIEKADYLKQFLPTLNARSTLGKQDADAYAVTPPMPPEQGHLPGMISLGPGYRTDSFFAEIGWRPAYHDLLDPDEGYTEGAQINFFNVRGRYYFKEDLLQLQQLRLIDIVSLSPRGEFFKPVSWKVNTGFDRELFRDGDEHLLYRINPGCGLSYQNGVLGIFYVLADTDLIFSRVLDDHYSLGFGGEAGFIKRVADSWKVNISGGGIFYGAGDKHRSLKASLATSYRVAENNGITLSYSHEKTFEQYRNEAQLMWNLYH